MTTLPPKPPTCGQQRILQFAARGNRCLRGTLVQPGSALTYHIVETSPTPLDESRIVQEVSPRIIASLTAAGWIEVSVKTTPAEGGHIHWWYRMTLAGITAANGPVRTAE